MAAGTFTVQGRKFRSQSQRQFVVVIVTEGASWIQIHKRSDSFATAKAHAQKFNWTREMGRTAVVIDTTTGEEV